ncbi:MAG: sulfatase-like hydrolase/transferase [Planctomycetota bacterium]
MKNIIYIIADQMRWDVLHCNGADFIKTPNFNRLAEEGINFSCAYSGSPVCVPARGVLATGCYSHNCMEPAAKNRNGGRIMPNHIHIANHLRGHGYSTYGVGKCHCLPYKINPGFDVFEVAEEGRIELSKELGSITEKDATEDYLEYLKKVGLYGMQRAHGIGNNDIRAGRSPLPQEHYVDTWATTRSLELLQEHTNKISNKPFYLQLGFVKPHAPYDPPVPFDEMYNPLEIPTPWGTQVDLEGRNPMMATYRPNYLINRMSDAAIQYSRAHYFGLISYLDSQIGRILDFLDKNNLRENTLIIFTADHGDNIGDHGLFFKTFFTEGSVHVPLLISFPGVTTAGSACNKAVGQEDIMPTICELVGIEIPRNIDGISLAKLIKNQFAEHKPFIVSQFDSGDGMMLMLRDNRYKYCFCRYESTEELYDLATDPHEMNNLVNDTVFNDTLVRIRILADQWCKANNHEPILTQNGNCVYSKFVLDEHLQEPSKLLGIRPW